MTSSDDKYCFIYAESEIKEELENLNQTNIKLDEDCKNSKGFTKVCFESGNDCDIYVNYNSGFVKKGDKTVHFATDALMYAAIFSDVNGYECQLKRLMNRTAELADIYKNKANFISSQECGNYINQELSELSNYARNFEDSNSISNLYSVAERVEQKNKYSNCKLW